MRVRAILAAWFVVAAMVPAASGQLLTDIDREPIDYHRAEATDPVARLQGRIDRGEVTLRFDEEGQGYLRSVLEYLGVPPESQALVFSKTSFQHARIAPRTPRAIYFGDDVYVGYVRGGDVLEFSAVDPKLGATFYLLDQQRSDAPAFVRQADSCLQCHHSAKTRDVPGHLVRSVYPDRRGYPVFGAGTFVTDHASPFPERWGGWYVTGTHGDQRHLGNLTVEDREHPEEVDRDAGANRVDLKGLVETAPYLTPHSDIVALMVLEHQTQLHNQIALAGYQERIGRHYDEGINEALGRPKGAISESTGRRIASQAEALVKGLLFSGEPPLTAPVRGTSGFAEAFAARGPRDRAGRSLRDLDLETRLFKYPCSYLVYSEAFDALPPLVKAATRERLRRVLDGREAGPAFAHLSAGDRRAILEILRDTKPELVAD